MKAVFVESLNGYMAKDATDDMLWTPSIDKKIFRLLTVSFGGVCVCSNNTYGLLPKKMLCDEHRTFIIASKSGPYTLKRLNERFPNAVLIGGPRFLRAAYDEGVIDTFIVNTVKKSIKNNSRYENPFIDELVQLETQCEIDFGEIVVRVYKNEYKY